MPSSAPSVAFPNAVHEIVRAGAGAGKTYTLTHKVMDLGEQSLRENGRLPRLIVTTFTRKATEELRERLMLLALEEKPHLLDFVNSRSQLVVSTIHGVMDLFLKRAGSEIGLDPSYRIVSAGEANKIARQALRQVLFEEGGKGEILESFQFNLLTKLIRRIDAISSESPDVKPFALADFEKLFNARAEKVAARLREASARILEEATKDTWIGIAEIFQKMAQALRGPWAETRTKFMLLVDAIPVIRRNPKGVNPVSDATMEFTKEVRDEAKEFLEPFFDPTAWAEFAKHYGEIENLARKFSALFLKTKLELGRLEIGDLERLAMICARQNPESVRAFAEEWDQWLIDEYQDTSPFQVELLRLLTGQSPTFVVGDPQQSIYLFRGARSEVFSEREAEVQGSGGQQHFLRMNRRSRPELLLFINDFFEGFNSQFKAMEPFYGENYARPASKPCVAQIYIAGAVTNDTEEAETGAQKEDKREREMRALVAFVQQRLSEGARAEEICVLGRTNQILTEAAEYLSRYRIPVHVHAASGFYDRREIRDALALLKFLANPHDSFNLVELLRSPWFRVPDHEVVDLAKRKDIAPSVSLWERLIGEASLASEFEAVRRLQGLLRASSTEGLTETFRRAMITSGFVDLSHLHDVSGRREANIWKLLARLQQDESQPGFNPIEFVRSTIGEMKLDEGNAEGDAVAAIEPNRVNLMTVHASKGLEFAHVCLPGADQKPRLTSHEDFTFDERVGKWALRAPFGDNRAMTASLPESEWLAEFRTQELREHARVLYVALTRASQSFYISWTGEPQAESWADLLRRYSGLNLEEGTHDRDDYAYSVSRAEPELLPLVSESAQAIDLRSPWRTKPLEGGESPRSVSELLEEGPGAAFKIETGREMAQLLRVASQGTAVHRLVEILKYPSGENINHLVERWFPGRAQDVLDAINFVREAKQPPLAQLIETGEVEWGFAFLEKTDAGSMIVEGQIDLWGRDDVTGEVWIVDYKTGNPNYRKKAFEQMSLYALAIRRSGRVKPDEKIQLAAVYPFAREIFTALEPEGNRLRELLTAARASAHSV